MSRIHHSFSIDCCAFCGFGGKKTCLSYYTVEPNCYITDCCKALICYKCNTSRGKCMACSSETFGRQEIKTDWNSRFSDYNDWKILCLSLRYMLPFTGSGQFGTWRDVIDICCRSIRNKHPRYDDLLRCYKRFVADFYSDQMLFHTLRTVPIRNLRLIALQPSQAMTEFFKNVASMAKFSRFSRKTVLNRYLFGLITLLFKRMIGEATLIQAYFLRKIVKYCLAKKASQKLPF